MDKKLLSEASAEIELLDIHLFTCNLQRWDEEIDTFSIKKSQKNTVEVTGEFYDPAEPTPHCHQLIHVKVNLKLEVYPKEDKENPLYSIEACFLAKYVQREEISDQALSEFIQHNPLHSVWPFWREHAMRTASLANLPRPHVHLMQHGNPKPVES